MKKLLIGLFVTSIMFACNTESAGTSETTETAVKECDANDVDSAAKCLCELYEIEDKLSADENADYEEFEKAIENTDKFNAEIDEAIANGMYTEADLIEAGNKIGCDI